jgi:ABC-type branched-subunit amino acid transport system substrate-binding protein
LAALAMATMVALTASAAGISDAGAADSSVGTGQGVTAKTIKLGLVQVDYDCIKQFVEFNRGDQRETYQVFVDDLNERGGIHGRKVEGVFRTFCPIGNASALSACTSFTEDDKVFAVVGVFLDQTGDAQLCIAREHETPLLIHNISQAWMDEAPPGFLVTPTITPDRRLDVVLDLLARRKTLDGKTVAVLGEADTKGRIEETVEPALKQMKVKQGTTAILTITGTDTAVAQAQLESFIERWKGERVGAFVLVGQVVVSKNFVTQLKEQFPRALLITDQTPVAYAAGQDAVAANERPNPYQGIISVGGLGEQATFETPSMQRCVDVYEKATGTKVIAPKDLEPGSDGKRVEVYVSIGDACSELTLFELIAKKAGKNLNNRTWQRAVNSMGRIDNQLVGTEWASLHEGKYDASDTFGLIAFDANRGTSGDWKPLTPVQNIAAS